MLVHVVHPVLYRFRPRRARLHRQDFGQGTTPVELREVAERPREALRTGNARVLAAEGQAWTVLALGGRNVMPVELAEYLARPAPDWTRDTDPRSKWALCSPLYFQTAVGSGRTGNLDVSGAEEVEGAERASADVRAFLDDRVRLHGDRVLVREERLVGLMDVHKARPRTVMGAFSRGEGTMSYRYPSLLAARPDRLAAVWALHDRPRKGAVPEGDWDALATLPPELLRDDDVAWMANRLPGTLLHLARDVAKARGEHPDSIALAATVPALEALQARAWTHAISGPELAPALATLRETLSLGIRVQERWAEIRPGTEPGMLGIYRFLLRALDAEYLPRLDRGPGRDLDEDALSGLAPR